MPMIGHIDTYDNSENFDTYIERLEQYFVANGIGQVASGAEDAVVNASNTK